MLPASCATEHIVNSHTTVFELTTFITGVLEQREFVIFRTEWGVGDNTHTHMAFA